MIIDTSALVGILDQEPDAERLVRAIATASERLLSAANLVETGIVLQVRRGDEASRDLDVWRKIHHRDHPRFRETGRHRAQGQGFFPDRQH